jgi:hypothetical protein
MGEVVPPPDPAFGVEGWLGSLVHQTGREDMTEAVFVLRPNLKRHTRPKGGRSQDLPPQTARGYFWAPTSGYRNLAIDPAAAMGV